MATLTAQYLPTLGRVRLTLGSPLPNVRYRLQRSTDGGTTWVDVRGGSGMGTLGVTVVDDYEYTPNVENQYRIIEPLFYDSFNRTYPTGATLELTGAADSYASTPDVAALDIVGDIEMLVDMAPAQWPPATDQTIMGKYADATANRSYRFDVLTTGKIRFTWSTDGTNNFSLSSSIPVDIIGGERIVVRVTFDADNGAAGRTARFYTSTGTIASGPFVELGIPQTSAGVTSIFSGTALLEVGSRNGGNNRFIGNIFAARVRNGIGGTIVANPSFTTQAPGTTNFVDSAGRTWTVQAGAAIIAVSPVPGSTWGTADTGQDWNLGGSSSGFSVWVNNGVGVVRSTGPVGHVVEQMTDNIPGLENGDITYSVIYPGSLDSLDQSLEWGVGLRTLDFNNGYESNIRFRPEAQGYEVELRIGKFVAGVYTLLGTADVGTWTPGIPWYVRFRVQGTSLAAKAWLEGDTEPTNWTVFVTDTSIVAGNAVYMRSFKASGLEFEQWFGPMEAHTIPPTVDSIATVTPVQAETFLKSITFPLLNRELNCVDWDALERDSRAGFFDIKGRHEILAIADVGSSSSFNLTFVTEDEATLRGIRSLLTYGGILYLQPPGDTEEDCPTDYSGIPDGFVMWDGHEERHSLRGTNTRGWTVGFTRVAAVDQAGVIPTTMTWQMLWDMIGPEGTWETVWATWPTWQDLWLEEGNVSSFGGEVL
jgi:hypothetical protein